MQLKLSDFDCISEFLLKLLYRLTLLKLSLRVMLVEVKQTKLVNPREELDTVSGNLKPLKTVRHIIDYHLRQILSEILEKLWKIRRSSCLSNSLQSIERRVEIRPLRWREDRTVPEAHPTHAKWNASAQSGWTTLASYNISALLFMLSIYNSKNC